MRSSIFVALMAGALACGGGGGGGSDPSGCEKGRACARACTEKSECGATEICWDQQLCGQPAPTSTDYAACALDAECPRGDYCSLGACAHDCLADRECTGGTVCSDRGRCIAAADVGKPPPLPTPSPGKPSVSPAFLDFGAGTSTLTFELTNDGGEPFSYRILSSRSWAAASPDKGELAAGSKATITVTLDREAAQRDSGQGGFIAVNTTAGYLRVNLGASLDLGGAWAGSLEVTSPLALGKHQLVLNLSQSGTSLFGWVDDEQSLLHPFRAVVNGDVFRSAAEEVVSFGFDLPSPKGSSLNPVYPQDVVRHFSFTGTWIDPATLSGTFTEAFDGLLDRQQTEIAGTAVFTRVGPAREGAAELAPAVSLTLAGNPMEESNGARKAPYQACSTCPGGSCPTNGAHALAFFRESSGGVPKLAFYNAFWQTAQASAGSPFQGTDACVLSGAQCAAAFDSQSLRCAQYWGWKGGPDTASYLLDGLEVAADAGLLVGNAYLSRAMDAWYDPLSSLSEQASLLARAEEKLVGGLHSASQAQPIALADPFFAKVLAGYAAGVVSTPWAYSLKASPVNADDSGRGSGEHLRRALRSLDAALYAANQRSDLLRRAQDDTGAEQSLREAAVRTWIDLAALAPALATAPETWNGDANPIAIGLRDAARRRRDLLQGRNLFGYAPAYVPYFWHYNADGSTNFKQILALAADSQATWAQLQNEASSNLRAFESSAGALSTELANQSAAIDLQLRDLCGAVVTSADACGNSKSGQLWDAILELQAAGLRVDGVEQQMINVQRAIIIEESRAAEVAGLHENQAVLILDTGERVYADERAMRKIDARARAAHGFLSGISGLLGAVAAVPPNPGAVVGPMLQGVAGAGIDAGATMSKEGYEHDKAEALATQAAQVEYNAAKEQLIDSAAKVKTELLQLDALAIDHDLALLNGVQVKSRLDAILARVKTLLEEKARAAGIANHNARYALHYRVYANAKERKAALAMNRALEWSFFATRALEYQLASTYGGWADLWSAREPSDLAAYLNGLRTAEGRQRTSQSNKDLVSLRDDILGMGAVVKDQVTGADLSPAERFRRFVVSPSTWDADGNLHITFATDRLDQRLFSSSVCSDRIQTVRANLIGDSLGANVGSGYVKLVHGGTVYLRSCVRTADGSTQLIGYDMTASGNGPATARVHAAVNGSTNGTPGMDPDVELFGRAVLASSWELIIDLHDNPGLNVFGLDDIELTFEHDSYTNQ